MKKQTGFIKADTVKGYGKMWEWATDKWKNILKESYRLASKLNTFYF